MARRVNKLKGVIEGIGVPVPTLRVGGVGDEGVGGEEAA